MLLVLYMGETTNRNAQRAVLVVEDVGHRTVVAPPKDAGIDPAAKRIIVRVEVEGYQTAFMVGDKFEPKIERPYGLIVLPRRPGLPVALEYDQQSYMAAPPIWKEERRLTLRANPAPGQQQP